MVVGIVTNLAIADYGLFVSILTTSVAYYILNRFVFPDQTLLAARAAKKG